MEISIRPSSHGGPLTTHERFIGFLIEHYAGNFPFWLAPDQVRVIKLNDDEALINHAKPIVAELRANMVRVDTDFSATPFKAKISNAEQLRVHTMLVIGGRDLEAGAVSVRLHHSGPQGAKPKAEVIADILASIKDAPGVKLTARISAGKSLAAVCRPNPDSHPSG
jgi:threonyl-tRNA synthetase